MQSRIILVYYEKNNILNLLWKISNCETQTGTDSEEYKTAGILPLPAAWYKVEKARKIELKP